MPEEARRADPLGLKLQTPVSGHVCAGNSLRKSAGAPNHQGISPAWILVILKATYKIKGKVSFSTLTANASLDVCVLPD